MLRHIEPFLVSVFGFFDRMVFGPQDRQFIEKAVVNVTHTLDYSKNPSNKEDIDHIYRLFEGLDRKAGALLSHISIIVAALAILYQDDKASFLWRTTLGIEIVFYLLFTFLCLRAIRMSSPWYDEETKTQQDDVSRLKFEYWKRKRCFNAATVATILATAVVLITLILHGTNLLNN